MYGNNKTWNFIKKAKNTRNSTSLWYKNKIDKTEFFDLHLPKPQNHMN